MPSLTILGSNPTAHVLRLACIQNAQIDISQVMIDELPAAPALTLPANLSRIICAVGSQNQLQSLSIQPDRKLFRLAKSGYLITEMPLGDFYSARYGAGLYNLSEKNLQDVLCSQTNTDFLKPLSHINTEKDLVAITPQIASKTMAIEDFSVSYVELPFDKKNARSNTTWIGNQQIAWQFSTPEATHIIFLIRNGQQLRFDDWHAELQDAARNAVPLAKPDYDMQPKYDISTKTRTVFLGEASHPYNPLFPESRHIGVEDSWVLSRMLENHDESIDEALSDYQKYRVARLNRVRRHENNEFIKLSAGRRTSRALQHLKLAMSTRFLPEIYMSSQDWFHGFDCLRGFR